MGTEDNIFILRDAIKTRILPCIFTELSPLNHLVL